MNLIQINCNYYYNKQ